MNVHEEVAQRLTALEAERGVRILYACESGSRAWGFASPDSDYDVRFLYLQPRDWYLAIDVERKRDVIETPLEGVWDINGWDVRKALNLLRKSNPPLLEWLGSPIVYREDKPVADELRRLLPRYYQPTACYYHYWKMARGNFREFLQGPEVRWKKYLYVLRPILAMRWIRQELGVVPTEFARLVDATVNTSDVRQAIDALLARKQSAGEAAQGPRDEVLHAFISAELERHEAEGVPLTESHEPVEPLNEFFRRLVA
jgi:predicted nucleotidyltransferase